MSRLMPRRGALLAGLVDPSIMPVGNLPGWTQIYAEDFNVNIPIGGFVRASNGHFDPSCAGYAYYDAKIAVYPDGWTDTDGNALYYPSKTLSTANSYADIYLHTETINGTAWPLGSTIKPKRPDGQYEQTFGRFTWRMRAQVSGPHFGCVALGIDSGTWPTSGEMDWPEGDVSGVIAGNYHYANSSGGQQPVSGLGKVWSDWHVYTVEWSPNLVRWFVDGACALSTTNQTPPGNLAWLIQAGSTGGAADPATTGHIQIDWICMYDYVAQ